MCIRLALVLLVAAALSGCEPIASSPYGGAYPGTPTEANELPAYQDDPARYAAYPGPYYFYGGGYPGPYGPGTP